MKETRSPRSMIAGAVVALLPLAGAFAQTPPPEPGSQPSEPAQQGATFESLDTDSDGRISKAEAAANVTVTQQFSTYDQNGDGYIERSEVNSANRSQSESPDQ